MSQALASQIATTEQSLQVLNQYNLGDVLSTQHAQKRPKMYLARQTLRATDIKHGMHTCDCGRNMGGIPPGYTSSHWFCRHMVDIKITVLTKTD